MSTNHFSTDLPEAQYWWAHHHQHTMEPPIKLSSSTDQNHNPIWPNSQVYHHQVNTTATNTAMVFNLNHHHQEDDNEEEADENDREKEEEEIIILKESMFEKPLTPSDVGKLNRLVIPKQHAEKYFPLSNSTDSVEKGLLLSFEDELGKSWKFRYSYWNSSQSYVLTKGWSRFVKEKKLDAGDIVLFERHHHDGDRFFIGWRRKGTPPPPPAATTQVVVHQDNGVAKPVTVVCGGGGSGGWTPVLYTSHPYPPPHGSSHIPYQTDYIHAGSIVQNQTSSSSGHPKRLRLFGVNLECQPDHDSEPSTPDGSSSMSSHDQLHQHHQQHQYYSNSHAYEHHNHMDEMNFSRDVNQSQMKYRHG